jgi:putative copper resistance protein D
VDIDAAIIICRLLHYAATMSIFGDSAFLWALAPAELADELGRRLRIPLVAAGCAATATTLAWLLLEVGDIGDSWTDAVTPQMIVAVLRDTSFGNAWLVSLPVSVAPFAVLLTRPGAASGALVAVSGLLAASLALVGHAASQERLLGALHRSNHVVHILATSAWLGALIPILLCLSVLDDAQRKSAAALALRRFSVVGHGVVLLVVVTGAADIAFVLGGWPMDWSSPYQRLLTIKIGFVALMIGFALLNRYVFVPRIERAPRQAIKALRYSTIAEIASGLMVLALVAAFETFEPA